MIWCLFYYFSIKSSLQCLTFSEHKGKEILYSLIKVAKGIRSNGATSIWSRGWVSEASRYRVADQRRDVNVDPFFLGSVPSKLHEISEGFGPFIIFTLLVGTKFKGVPKTSVVKTSNTIFNIIFEKKKDNGQNIKLLDKYRMSWAMSEPKEKDKNW